MVTEWLIRAYLAALAEQAAKAEATADLGAPTFNASRTAASFTDLPEYDADWWPFTTLDFGGGVVRVVRELSGGYLTWQRPIGATEALAIGETARISSLPLAKARVQYGCEPTGGRAVALFIGETQMVETGPGHEFGSRSARLSGLAVCRYRTEVENDDQRLANGLLTHRMAAQVAEILEYGLPAGVPAAWATRILADTETETVKARVTVTDEVGVLFSVGEMEV